jgi:hypothetical protein
MGGIKGIYLALDRDSLWVAVNAAVKIGLHTMGEYLDWLRNYYI